MRMKYAWAGLLVLMLSVLAGPAAGQGKAKTGKVKMVGKYERVKLKEGKKQKTYFVLEAGKQLQLKAGGPTAFVLLGRSKVKRQVTFELDMDGEQTGQAKIELLKKISRGFYVKVPEGAHQLTIVSSQDVMVRPVKRTRKPNAYEPLVSWKSKSAAVAVSAKDKSDNLDIPSLVPPEDKPELKEETLDIPSLVATKPEPKPETKPAVEATKGPAKTDSKAGGLTSPKLVRTTPLLSDSPPSEAQVDLSNRPVEVRLRILADKLAAAFKKLPGQGRYERLVVAHFNESGQETRDMELGTLVSVQLNTFLKRDHNFFMLERDRLADILNEMEMAMTGLVEPDQAAKIGKMLGAQAVVVGNVAQAGADFVVTARLISAENATVLVADSINVPRAGMVALSDEAVVLRSRGGAVFRSMVVPGWGQFYNQEPIKGGIVIGVELAVIGTALAMHFLGRSDQNAYEAADFALNYPDLDPTELGQKASALRESAEDYYQARNILIYSAIGVYLYNILDAYIFGIDGEKEAGLQVVPMGTVDTQGVFAPGVGMGFAY